jgi:uridine kinase
MVTIGRYDELARVLLACDGPVRLVGIDGCGGAGKTTFATRLARAAGGVPVVHTDDFASHDVPIEWWPRMLTAVVEPLLAGRPAAYAAYDWVRRAEGETITIEPAPIVVIEGVGACRAASRRYLAMSIWVEAPRDERHRRGLARDGVELAGFWREWIVAEDAYVAAEHPERHANLVVDGAATVPYDAEREFVIARATDAAASMRTRVRR